MFSFEANSEIQKIPLSNNIRRRVQDVGKNVEEKIKDFNGFCLQIDKSTDISGKCYLIGFIRFINNDNIIKQFFCCKEMKETTTGLDVFSIIDSYLKLLNLSWKSCFGICTDGAPIMTGSIKGFVSLVKGYNKNILATRYFLHIDALIAKTIGPH